MRTIRLLSAVCLLLLASCTPTKLINDVSRIDESVSDLSKLQAEQTTRISALESQLRQLSGRLEELEYSQNKRIGSDLNSLKQDLSNLRRRVPPPAIVPAATLDADETTAERMPADYGKQFLDALTKLREGDFSQAISSFEELRGLTEGSEYHVLTLFWLAVAHEGMGENREALSAYLDAISHYPKNPRTPLMLSRQASVLMRLKDKKAAKATLHKLLADFPKSEEAFKAKERLKEL